eukprot:TRINITY_DN42147_c0_g1_i1.p1 TRINITY_DN42147_c0_g1~~TRINITY_DN42147_c0_g1_i1.p1  ORF type:complete len:282 (+),score=54.79 TRINITY_DN42147_c0_g1_i1:102-947(+)
MYYCCCCEARSGEEPVNLDAGARFGSNLPGEIHVRSKGPDAERFDKAIETNDLRAFVKLLDSSQAIDCYEQMHPWADNPQTVGALVGCRLAMLAQNQQKEQIGKAGAIPKLVAFLSSGEQDRVQTAVVALSFLTAGCAKNAVMTYQAGAMELLVQFLDAPVAGMRAATSTTIRNICIEDTAYRHRFVELGGLDRLARQLSNVPPDVPNRRDMQLEMVLNLYDLIESADGMLIEDYARIAIEAGAVQGLKSMLDGANNELAGTVQEVLASLAMVKPTNGRRP